MVKIIFVLVFILAYQNFPQRISAEAYTDSANYLVGDYINLTVKIKFSEDIKIRSPLIKEAIKEAEILKADEPYLSKENDDQVAVFKYVISVYDSVDISSPGISVGFTAGRDTALQSIYTNPVNFTVHTVEVRPDEEIKDVKEPIKIPLDWKTVLIYVLIVLVIAALAYFLYRRYKKKLAGREEVKEEVPKIPSYITALNSLHKLEEEELWQKGKVKEYHSSITEIIRRYFEERFYLPALELTTTEAMKRLKERSDTFEIQHITEQFLNNADLVKFAKYNPVPDLNNVMMKQAYHIVEKTIPKERANKEVIRNAG